MQYIYLNVLVLHRKLQDENGFGVITQSHCNYHLPIIDIKPRSHLIGKIEIVEYHFGLTPYASCNNVRQTAYLFPDDLRLKDRCITVFTSYGEKMHVAEAGNAYTPRRYYPRVHRGIYQLLINDHYLQTLF